MYVLFPLPSTIFHKDTCPRRQISRELTSIQFRRIGDYLFRLAILSTIAKLYFYDIGILNKKWHTTTMLTAMVLPPISININEICVFGTRLRKHSNLYSPVHPSLKYLYISIHIVERNTTLLFLSNDLIGIKTLTSTPNVFLR